MPVLAVAGAIAGASALATVGATALGVLGTISAIGGIVSGIGAVTGNKTLMKVGAVAGLVGGVGAFAQSQGLLASGSAAETAANSVQPDMITQLKNTASGAEAVSPTQGLADAVNPTDARLATGTQSSPIGSSVAQETGGLNATSDLATQQNSLLKDATQTMGGPPARSLYDTADPLQSVAPRTPMQDAGADMDAGGITPLRSSASGEKSILDTMKGLFLDKDGKVSKEALAFGFNFLGGAFDDRKKAEAEWLRARTETERAQLANGNAVPALGLKLAQKPTIFKPAGATYNPVQTGLYNAR